jgi:ATP-dependent Zn protease
MPTVVESGVAIERPAGPHLASLAGMDDVRRFGEALAIDLADYKAGNILWSDIDSGCLLFGPPGTGKTTVARAIAARCGTAFVATSYADWSGGEAGADIIERLRAVFDAARKNAPCVLFIDEIDSLPRRGSGAHNASYFAVINNALLEEIAGTKRRDGVIIIAACNDPTHLDPALIRSGRLDQMIEIPLPSPEALAGIFRYHLGTDVLKVRDLDSIALNCIGKSGADIEKIVRESRRLSRQSGERLSDEHLLQVITRSASKLSPEELRTTAVHEAGHAIVSFRQGDKKILISLAAGVTFSRPGNGPRVSTREGVTAQLVRLLAGRAAEEILLGTITGGAGGTDSSDLACASKLALDAIAKRGLSARGHLMWYEAPASRLMLETYCGEETNDWLSEAYQQALVQIRHEAVFVALTARALLKQGVVSDEDLRSIDNAMKNIPPDMSKGEVLGVLGFALQKCSHSETMNGELLGAGNQFA